MLDYIQRGRFTELIISTPGPVGLCALGCAKLLGLRTSGIYHTDFPQYARFLSDDAFMESMVWNYMQWFYGQTDLLYVNSEFYPPLLDRPRHRAGQAAHLPARARH